MQFVKSVVDTYTTSLIFGIVYLFYTTPFIRSGEPQIHLIVGIAFVSIIIRNSDKIFVYVISYFIYYTYTSVEVKNPFVQVTYPLVSAYFFLEYGYLYTTEIYFALVVMFTIKVTVLSYKRDRAS